MEARARPGPTFRRRRASYQVGGRPMRTTTLRTVLVMLGTLAVLCGCAPHPGLPVHNTEASDLVGRTWVLGEVTTHGRAIEPRGGGELEFSADGTMRGSAGCHGF